MLPVALQLYSIREYTEKDFAGTLKKVAAMGYQGVEFAGYGGLTALEVKALLDETGLKAAGSHISLEQFENHLDEIIEFAKVIGNKYLICPWAATGNKAELDKLISVLKPAAKKIAEAGLIAGYHNHDQEFTKIDGEYALDIMFKEIPELQAEIDTYWVEKAGLNAAEYTSQFKNRLPLIHLKDMLADKSESTELCTGIMDIAALVKVANECGSDWLIIEQEAYTMPPIESVELGLNNLKKINL